MARRDPQRIQFWQTRIAEWKQSGQSISAFCSHRGVCKSGFYRWQRLIADERSPRIPPTPAFVPVRAVADILAEVVLPSGLVIRLPLASDPDAITRLVAAVRAVAC